MHPNISLDKLVSEPNSFLTPCQCRVLHPLPSPPLPSYLGAELGWAATWSRTSEKWVNLGCYNG
jgi:hypothetical protein